MYIRKLALNHCDKLNNYQKVVYVCIYVCMYVPVSIYDGFPLFLLESHEHSVG